MIAEAKAATATPRVRKRERVVRLAARVRSLFRRRPAPSSSAAHGPEIYAELPDATLLSVRCDLSAASNVNSFGALGGALQSATREALRRQCG